MKNFIFGYICGVISIIGLLLAILGYFLELEERNDEDT